MEKPGSLRAAIEAYLPDLKRDPDRLRMWVEQGAVRSVQGADASFLLQYKLTGVLIEYPGHPSLVWLAINNWLAAYQPDLLAPLTPGYRFEADILDSETVDLQFELDLDEVVSVTPRDGGGYELIHRIVAAPLDTELADPPALLKQIWSKGKKLVPE
jgi:hypothetical protein